MKGKDERKIYTRGIIRKWLGRRYEKPTIK